VCKIVLSPLIIAIVNVLIVLFVHLFNAIVVVAAAAADDDAYE
jgi:hypothetical protein